MFVSRKIKRQDSPFLKEKSFQPLKAKLFFGPEINDQAQQKPIFSKNFFIWLIVLSVVFLYLVLGIISLFRPPKINISSPTDNYITDQTIITIKGEVSDHKAIVTLNNQVINLDNQGFFEEKVSLSPGVNSIKISARRKFGSTNTIFRQVVVK